MVEVCNTLLQFQYHRAGGVNERDVVLLGGLVGEGRFPMRADEHGGVAQLLELLVTDHPQTEVGEAFHLLVVVHNIPQAIQGFVVRQVLFRRLDGVNHSEAES